MQQVASTRSLLSGLFSALKPSDQKRQGFRLRACRAGAPRRRYPHRDV